jgi:hypothetical protein
VTRARLAAEHRTSEHPNIQHRREEEPEVKGNSE